MRLRGFRAAHRPQDWVRDRTRRIAGNSIGGEEGGGDLFAADQVWLYITLLTIGYMLSCGIAKSGVYEPYWSERGDSDMDH
jgi:hypothetical protein